MQLSALPFHHHCDNGIQLLVIVFLILNLHIQGFSLYDIVFHMLQSANRYMSMRYANQIVPNPFSQIALILNYCGVVLGGILLLYTKNIRQAVLTVAISFLPSIMIMLTQAAKGYIFLSAVLFYSGVLIARLNMGDLSLSNKKTNKIILSLILVTLPLLIASFMARGLYRYDSDIIVEKLLYYFSSYAFGHLYAFTDWFSHLIDHHSRLEYAPVSSPYYGFYTFMSLFKLLGSHLSVPPGVYNEYLLYPEILKTNIYTIFRGLILDFGLWGTLIFWFLFGFLIHLSFYILLIAKRPVVSLTIFAFSIAFMYMSYIISLLMWNSIFASVIVLSVILYTNKYFVLRTKQEPSTSPDALKGNIS